MPKSKIGKQVRGAEYPAETIKIPDSENYSCRKIGNGWLLSSSGHRDGKYYSEETFSREKPIINPKAKGGMKEEKRGKGKA